MPKFSSSFVTWETNNAAQSGSPKNPSYSCFLWASVTSEQKLNVSYPRGGKKLFAELQWLFCVCRTLWITWSAGSASPTALPATCWASTSGGAAGAALGTCSYRRCPRDRRKKRGHRTGTLSADQPLCPCWRLPVSPSPPTKTGMLFPFIMNLM